MPGKEQTAILTVWDANQTMLGRQKSTQAVLGDDTGNVRACVVQQPLAGIPIEARQSGSC